MNFNLTLPVGLAFALAACGLVGSPLPCRAADGFSWDGRLLSVRNGAAELAVANGALIKLRHAEDDRGDWGALPDQTSLAALPWGVSRKSNWSAFAGQWRKGGSAASAPDSWSQPPATAAWGFTRLNDRIGELTTVAAAGGPPAAAFRYRVERHPAGRGFVVAATARVPGAAATGFSLLLPGFAGPAVILGNGVRHARAEARSFDRCVRETNNLYSPAIAIAETADGCWAVWPESVTAACDIVLLHAPEADHLVLETRAGLPLAPGNEVTSARWRIGWFADWVAAVRQYRAEFELATGAVPLWRQNPAWVRDIHAVCTGMPDSAKAEEYYAELARQIEPRKLLLFYWNGSFLLAFGDHRHGIRSGRPAPAVMDAFLRRGFPWMGYHPYNMIPSPKGLEKQVAEWRRKGELPPGYTFQPDWGGAAERFHAWFKPFAAGYYKPLEEADTWILHPAATEVRDYLAHNFGAYAAVHRMAGAYLDILGADHSSHYPDDRTRFGGNDYRGGEALAVAAMRERNPGLALMSECESAWTVSRTFYTWEGASHVHLPKRHPAIGVPLPNHPLRTAAWGSYCWTREQELEATDAALLGCLPELIPGDDWGTARAVLFAREEFYPDLPDTSWEPAVKACYRGRDGRRFEFRDMPWGDGYVELAGAARKLLLGRLRGQTASPLAEPVSIQGWHAYTDGGCPVGLNPVQSYPFLLRPPPAATGSLRITGVPAGSHVQAVREAKEWCVVELGSQVPAAAAEGDVTLLLPRGAVRIADAGREWHGPFAAGQRLTVRTQVPGGLVCLWEPAVPADGRFRTDFLSVRGRGLARGVADERYCSNSLSSVRPELVNGRNLPTLVLAPGRYRGYAEQWVRLADSATPVLKFDIRLPVAGDGKGNRLIGAVAVNGLELWREEFVPAATWLSREISLTAWAGRTVLLTFSALACGGNDTFPEPGDSPLFFSRVRVDGNPDHLPEWLDPLAPPGPPEILFADPFRVLPPANGWRVETSAAQPAAAVTVSDGRVGFTGQHYKYLYLARPLPAGELSLQARMQVSRSGCLPAWNPGLAVFWGRDAYAFLTVGGFKGGDEVAVIRGLGAKEVRLTGLRLRVLDDNLYDVWIRVVVRDDTIAYSVSVDGTTWLPVAEAPRPAAGREVPATLLLGRGMPGAGDEFRNDERWETMMGTVYAGEVVVGRPRR